MLFFKMLIFVFLLNFPVVFGQAVGKRFPTPPAYQKAEQILRDLVVTHPKKEVRDNLDYWIRSRKVYYSFFSDMMPPEMGTQLVRMDGRSVPTLVVNPDFLLKSKSFDLREDKLYKQLVIYHEYKHLADHFSGEIVMQDPIFSEGQIPQRAEHIWNSEYAATVAEWQLAKDLGRENLMPTIYESVKKYAEKRGFLEGFYKLLKNAPVVVQPEKFRPHWENIYRAKKKVLSDAR